MSIPKHIQKKAYQHPLFKSLNQDEAGLIFSCLEYLKISPHDTIFEESQVGHQCFFILSGQIKVSKTLESGTKEQLAILKAGGIFGQIALIDRKPRSATCQAGDQPVILLSLSTDNFERLYQAQNIFAYKILDHIVIDLSKRLRGATEQLQKAKLTPNQKQRHSHSIKAAKFLQGSDSSDELDQLEVLTTEFEDSFKYTR